MQPSQSKVATAAEIEQTVIRLAAEQAGVSAEQVTPASAFVQDLNFDSLDMVEYVMLVEEAFDVKISDDEAAEAKTVGDAARLVRERLASV